MDASTHRSDPESSVKSTRTASVSVRVSADEKQAIVTAAQRDGLEAGAWLRSLGLKEARRAEASR